MIVTVQCVGCKMRREVKRGEVPKGEMPFCERCGLPMVAISARTIVEPKIRTNSAGAALRAWRVKHRLTQAQVAAQVGCKASEVSHYEKGRTPADERRDKLVALTKGAVTWRY